ncbi:putative cytosolic 60S ribosomal protein Rpl28 [Triangularia verruculosa]|uniref:Cytosolic 60S ribosomal protein Rpl28 n=1 Tax=Triangularia verruculosa TaxID=2587418 RepID=A0AAN7AU02_9PEZI|nr:putative cytosolic 60S ribosomal protein Rpl28 [Triangularia verruculosa]
MTNVSADLIWEVARLQNAFLVKRKASGGVQFSRDPLNLLNVHSRKHAGFVNDKALGVVAGENGAIQVISKKTSAANKPASARTVSTVGASKANRKTYKAIARQVAKSGYRADLRQAAVARASALRAAQRPVKPTPEPKLRGNAAKRAAEKSE